MKSIYISALVLSLTACGGGGSDGGSESLRVFAQSDEIIVTGNAMQSVSDYAYFDSKGKTERDIYFGIEDSSNKLLQYAELNFTSDTSGHFRLDFNPGYMIGDGETASTLNLAFCYDDMCNKHVKGSPMSIPVTYQVTLDDQLLPVDSTEINIATQLYSQGDENILTKQIEITGENKENLFYRTSHDKNVANTFTYLPSPHGLDIDIQLQLANIIGTGQHTSELKVDACYDEQCLYPIPGSPVSYAVDYEVTANNTITDNSIAINERIDFPFLIQESEYIAGLDIIVMTSTSPENAVYVYDINANSTAKFPTNFDVSSLLLAVDRVTKLGRIAVSYFDHSQSEIMIIDYNAQAGENSPVKRITADYGVEYLVVKNETLLLFPSSSYENPTRLNIATGVTTDPGYMYYYNHKLQLTNNADALYKMSLASSPQKIERVTLGANLSFGQAFSSPYHGDYPLGDFWLNQDETLIYSAYGNVFASSDVESEDGLFQFKLDQNIGSFADTKNNIAISEAKIEKVNYYNQAVAYQVNIFDTAQHNLQQAITLPKHGDNLMKPILLVYANNGALFALTVTEDYKTYSLSKIAQ